MVWSICEDSTKILNEFHEIYMVFKYQGVLISEVSGINVCTLIQMRPRTSAGNIKDAGNGREANILPSRKEG